MLSQPSGGWVWWAGFEGRPSVTFTPSLLSVAGAFNYDEVLFPQLCYLIWQKGADPGGPSLIL